MQDVPIPGFSNIVLSIMLAVESSVPLLSMRKRVIFVK